MQEVWQEPINSKKFSGTLGENQGDHPSPYPKIPGGMDNERKRQLHDGTAGALITAGVILGYLFIQAGYYFPEFWESRFSKAGSPDSSENPPGRRHLGPCFTLTI
jgi:hypothetical protein